LDRHIRGLGDTVDVAIIGGRRDAKDVAQLRIGKLSWTSFYLGCLENKEEVCRFDAKAKFRVVDTIGRHSILKKDILYPNQRGNFHQLPFAFSRFELDIKLDQTQLLRPTELFKHLFVAKVIGAGFDKPANARCYALRFSRVQKIYHDRIYKDTVSFDELQEIARKGVDPLQDDDGEEECR
jgi:DNA ligase 4